MFWKYLLIWAIAGAILEFITYGSIGAYMAWREEKEGLNEEDCFDSETVIFNCLVNHYKWLNCLGGISPHALAEVISICWTAIVWPLDIPLVIRDAKKEIDRVIQKRVDKAS